MTARDDWVQFHADVRAFGAAIINALLPTLLRARVPGIEPYARLVVAGLTRCLS